MALSNAERQARHRARVASRLRDAEALVNATAAPSHRQVSRPRRWADAVGRAATALQDLQDLQSEYQDWQNTLPENLADSATAQKLDEIASLDLEPAITALDEAENIDLPRGFGRD